MGDGSGKGEKQGGGGRGKKQPITTATVKAWVAALESRSVIWGEQDFRKRVQLEWRGDEVPERRAWALGVGAKCLLVLQFMAGACLPDDDIADKLGLDRDALRQLFLPPTGNKSRDKSLLKDPRRYVVTAPGEEARDAVEEVLSALIAQAMAMRDRSARPLSPAELLNQPIPLNEGADTVGAGPLEYFRDYLRTGICLNTRVEAGRKDEANTPFLSSKPIARLVEHILAAPASEHAHRRIVNIVVPFADAKWHTIGEELEEAITGLAPNTNFMWKPIRVSLCAGSSRQGVLETLQTVGQMVKAQATEAGVASGPIDLHGDMRGIREVLTLYPVVVIFEHWDNVTGTFGALHDFLCNTHWGEFIRVLAQPVTSRLKAKNMDQPASRLVVISSAAAGELRPWLDGPHVLPPGSQRTDSTLILTRADADVASGAGAGKAALAQLALRFVAASVNGMQRGTLQRCLSQWIAIFDSGRQAEVPWLYDKEGFGDFVTDLLTRFNSELEEAEDGIRPEPCFCG